MGYLMIRIPYCRSIEFDLRQTRLGTALLIAAVMDDVVAFVLAKLLGVIGNDPDAGRAVLGKEIGRVFGVTIGIKLSVCRSQCTLFDMRAVS